MRSLFVTSPLFLVVATAGAQVHADPWHSLDALRSGEKVEVIDQQLKRYTGELRAVADDAIALIDGKKEIAISRDEVFRVGVRDRGRRWRNVGIGAAVGLGLGTLIGAKPSGEDSDILIVAGAVYGTAAGAGIGALLPGYRTVYRARRRLAPATAAP